MNQPLSEPFYISVDVETAGPNPSTYSLLTIGACTIDEHPQTFYIELKPVNNKMDPQAFALHHLELKRLIERGVPPTEAMSSFENWLKQITPAGMTPIFLSYDAPFEWMFIHDYFQRFLGRNPFGNAALDIKAFYAGFSGQNWNAITTGYLSERYLNNREFTHHSLRDAIDQAEIFRKLLVERRS